VPALQAMEHEPPAQWSFFVHDELAVQVSAQVPASHPISPLQAPCCVHSTAQLAPEQLTACAQLFCPEQLTLTVPVPVAATACAHAFCPEQVTPQKEPLQVIALVQVFCAVHSTEQGIPAGQVIAVVQAPLVLQAKTHVPASQPPPASAQARHPAEGLASGGASLPVSCAASLVWVASVPASDGGAASFAPSAVAPSVAASLAIVASAPASAVPASAGSPVPTRSRPHAATDVQSQASHKPRRILSS
jgi:hypothetical protein